MAGLAALGANAQTVAVSDVMADPVVNQQLTLVQIVDERLVRGQEVDSSNPIAPTISFPSQINVLRRILNCHL
jgi:hypothetical protein